MRLATPNNHLVGSHIDPAGAHIHWLAGVYILSMYIYTCLYIHAWHIHPCLQGPREDSGARSSVDPGVRLVKQLYSYAKAYHPKTKIMASGIRTRDGEAIQ